MTRDHSIDSPYIPEFKNNIKINYFNMKFILYDHPPNSCYIYIPNEYQIISADITAKLKIPSN